LRPVVALVVVALVGGGIALASHNNAPPRPPIVFVVFDAFPESMLMQPGGGIDSARFPGFAQLASDSTWYRNATTVHDSTIKSIPAMLDGRWPSNARQPLIADHPVNLFTLLRPSYKVWADEEGTQLCPVSLCNEKRARLLYLLHGRREQRFRAALSVIGSHSTDKRPPLYFVHVLLPHEPLRFMPGGQVYEGGADPEPGLDGNESFDNEFLAQQAEQRHLLQAMYTDSLLRELIARLEAAGLYDKSLVIVTADHGISFHVKGSPAEPFRPGQIGWRRDLTKHNAHDVAFVPMFVKKPHQDQGQIDDTWVRTTDILPTILRSAQLKKIPRAVSSDALGTRPQRPPESLSLVTNRAGVVELDPATLLRRRASAIAQRARRFGVGADMAQLFRVGPHPELIGRSPEGMAPLRARFYGPRRFLDVDLKGQRVPSNVIGWLDGRRVAGRDLAVSVNGRIAAVGKSFKPIGSTGMNFSLLVPPSAFRQGRNAVRLYEIRQ
jgi:hypothetical protein